MRLQQFQNSYLYEGLDRSATNTMMLWESAGFKLKEAALTADQIQQIFQSVEQGATAAGDNRTLIGKGKDATAAVNKAWEDLKTKVQNSGPIKAVDQKYDDAVAKIEAGLGGPDNAISKVIMGYRKFAKEYPIAQSLIYGALIAAAGISGAGLGGAAVLGLLKMADKLLQGEKFSSAAYSGAKTGAMAYGASKIGDMIKGKPGGGEVPADMQQGLASDQAFQDRLLNKYPPDKGYTFAAGEGGKSIEVLDASGTKVFTGGMPLKTMDPKTFVDLTNKGQMATPGISSGSISGDPTAGVSNSGSGLMNITGSQGSQAQRAMYQAIEADPSLAKNAGALADIYYDKLADLNPNVDLDYLRSVADSAGMKLAAGVGESIAYTGKKLSEGQVYMVFNRVCAQQQLNEGPIWDKVKGAASNAWQREKEFAAKGIDKLKTVGKNLTTKVTADKLNSAWKKAGSPMDSEEVAKILSAAGVGDDVVKQVYTDLKISAAPAAQASDSSYAEIKKAIAQLNTKDRTRMIAYLTKQIGTA